MNGFDAIRSSTCSDRTESCKRLAGPGTSRAEDALVESRLRTEGRFRFSLVKGTELEVSERWQSG